MIGFESPNMLWGLLGLALPILAHLFQRGLADRMPFPAAWLLLAATQDQAKRARLKRLLLLLLRILAIACLVLTFAAPGRRAAEQSGTQGGRSASVGAMGPLPGVLVVLDGSRSMGQTQGGAAVWPEAIAAVQQVLGDVANGQTPVEVWVAGATVQPLLPQATTQKAPIEKALADVTPGDGMVDWPAVLQQAVTHVEAMTPTGRLFVVSDQTLDLKAVVPVRAIRVGPQPEANWGIVGLKNAEGDAGPTSAASRTADQSQTLFAGPILRGGMRLSVGVAGFGGRDEDGHRLPVAPGEKLKVIASVNGQDVAETEPFDAAALANANTPVAQPTWLDLWLPALDKEAAAAPSLTLTLRLTSGSESLGTPGSGASGNGALGSAQVASVNNQGDASNAPDFPSGGSGGGGGLGADDVLVLTVPVAEPQPVAVVVASDVDAGAGATQSRWLNLAWSVGLQQSGRTGADLPGAGNGPFTGVAVADDPAALPAGLGQGPVVRLVPLAGLVAGDVPGATPGGENWLPTRWHDWVASGGQLWVVPVETPGEMTSQAIDAATHLAEVQPTDTPLLAGLGGQAGRVGAGVDIGQSLASVTLPGMSTQGVAWPQAVVDGAGDAQDWLLADGGQPVMGVVAMGQGQIVWTTVSVPRWVPSGWLVPVSRRVLGHLAASGATSQAGSPVQDAMLGTRVAVLRPMPGASQTPNWSVIQPDGTTLTPGLTRQGASLLVHWPVDRAGTFQLIETVGNGAAEGGQPVAHVTAAPGWAETDLAPAPEPIVCEGTGRRRDLFTADQQLADTLSDRSQPWWPWCLGACLLCMALELILAAPAAGMGKSRKTNPRLAAKGDA